MNQDPTRKHLHDLANYFSIIDGSVSRVVSLLEKNRPEATEELQRLKKAKDYIKKSFDALEHLKLTHSRGDEV